MAISAATKANLQRKSAYVDHVQLVNGKPLFSWIDLSLTELCNRSGPAREGHKACVFCPRIDPKFYPNQNLHMSMKLVEKIARELDDLAYEGVVVLCGFGEPMLHPNILDVVKAFNCRVELVTNGDFLGPIRIEALVNAGLDYFVVSLYDGPHQVEKQHKDFVDAGVPKDIYLLRDRWHSEEDQFGLKLTNRAGTVTAGKQEEVDTHRPCHYLTYQMQVDWNGDVLLCPQDWWKKVKYGNLGLDSLQEVWFSKRMMKRRMQLIKGQRTEAPCSSCNTDGTLHGFNHVAEWVK